MFKPYHGGRLARRLQCIKVSIRWEARSKYPGVSGHLRFSGRGKASKFKSVKPHCIQRSLFALRLVQHTFTGATNIGLQCGYMTVE
jgi:hypothetical protein